MNQILENNESTPKEQKIRRWAFHGTFTPEICEELRRHVKSLGVPHAAIARYLGVTLSTFSKWLSGSSHSCHPSKIHGLSEFLEGHLDNSVRHAFFEYSGEKYAIDHSFLQKNLSKYPIIPQWVDEPEAEAEKKIIALPQLYALFLYSCRRGTGKIFLKNLNRKISNALREMILLLFVQPHSGQVVQELLGLSSSED